MKASETLTWKDIHEIPALLEDFSRDAHEKLGGSILKAADESVYLIGRGSSGNATLFAKYVWETYAGVRTDFIHPHAIFEAKLPLNFKDKAVWAFSQSGQSTDVVECLRRMMSWGAKGVAVTNEADPAKNTLAGIADRHILLSSSKETVVAATKSFELQLWLCLWTAQLWAKCFDADDFARTIGITGAMLQSAGGNANFAFWPALKKAPVVAFVGRGPMFAVAEDAALKFREMAGVHASAYSAAEFLHGPIGAHGPEDLVLLLSPSREALPPDLEKVRGALDSRGTTHHILSPAGGKPPFNSVVLDTELKLAALHFAVEKGLDPDRPRGLKKVTPTL
ncbi:MAG: SIS domain-containing protein [Elusimicrobiales bacterium]|nr:SIS domain-containing protein [Elusimicrobiales bacterium]